VGRHGAAPWLDSALRICTHAAVAGLNSQLMTDEIEVDLEPSRTVRNGPSGKPSGGNVERYMPRVIDPGTLREANLPDDLGP
jgi:hypothetical protein